MNNYVVSPSVRLRYLLVMTAIGFVVMVIGGILPPAMGWMSPIGGAMALTGAGFGLMTTYVTIRKGDRSPAMHGFQRTARNA